ncbi:MAG TPA: cytochrome C oxidase subunit IV family protein [Flavipsychrobacter sp.]|jgi:cytochrome c oxidase subunit IV|nr:cytochrome C oxidase subunit IV family protein [Chitinophagales bacterium]HLO69612.1 cytochrome C oxidase subunit IV family protein [Flavipsychrobacter sp.]
MSAHHSSDNIQHLYEGDQSKLYSGVMSHHTDINSADSKKQIGRIWKVFWILLAITIVEVVVGMFFSASMPRGVVNFFFLALTILKAGYIVSVFMHLGDEVKSFMITVLVPLFLFIWFIIAFLYDGGFWLEMNTTVPIR